MIGLTGCVGAEDGDDVEDDTDEEPTDDDEPTADDVEDDADDEPTETDDLEITFATAFEPGHILVEAAEMFSERVEDESDGEITVEVEPGGAYGSSEEIADLCRDGVIEMHVTGPTPITAYAGEWDFLHIPFVIENHEHYSLFMHGDDTEEMRQSLMDSGNQIPIGTPIHRGYRQFTSNVPIENAETFDEHDIELRLPEVEVLFDVWSAIGADPTPVSLDELYSSLQTGVVNASEGDISQINSFSLYEVQDYLSMTNHVYSAGDFYINVDFYEDLNESNRDLLDEIVEEVTLEAHEMSVENEDEIVEETLAAGMEQVETDAETLEERALPVIEEEFEERYQGTPEDWTLEALQ